MLLVMALIISSGIISNNINISATTKVKAETVAKAQTKPTAVYRVYNPNARDAGSHHFTSDYKEAQDLVNKGWNWDNKGKDGKGKPVFYSSLPDKENVTMNHRYYCDPRKRCATKSGKYASDHQYVETDKEVAALRKKGYTSEDKKKGQVNKKARFNVVSIKKYKENLKLGAVGTVKKDKNPIMKGGKPVTGQTHKTLLPVYMFVNPTSGEHFYTTDYNRKNKKSEGTVLEKEWKKKGKLVYYVGTVNPVVYGRVLSMNENGEGNIPKTKYDFSFHIFGKNFMPQSTSYPVKFIYYVKVSSGKSVKFEMDLHKVLLTKNKIIYGANGDEIKVPADAISNPQMLLSDNRNSVTIRTTNGGTSIPISDIVGDKQNNEKSYWKLGNYSATYHSNFPINIRNLTISANCFLFADRFCDFFLSENWLSNRMGEKKDDFEAIIGDHMDDNNYTYDLSSWNTRADGKGKKYLDNELLFNQTKSITLYAQWKKEKK
jgi:hypothetical protein